MSSDHFERTAHHYDANGGVHEHVAAQRPPVAEIRPKRTRRNLVIAGSAAGALVLGAGAYVGINLWQKSQGSVSPAAAVEKLADGLDGSLDPIALYGAISHPEIDFAALTFASALGLEPTTVAPTSRTVDKDSWLAIADAATIEITDLEASEQQQFGDSASRVRVDSGELRVRLDAEAFIADLAAHAESVSDLTLLWETMLFGLGDYDEPLAERIDSAEMRETLRKTFPLAISLSTDGMELTTVGGKHKTVDGPVTIMTVKEQGKWFVSPVLTVLDQAFEESDPDPGNINEAELAAGAGAESSEQAVADAATAVESFWSSGDPGDLYSVLPFVERRALMFLAPVVSEQMAGREKVADLELALKTSSAGEQGNSEFRVVDEIHGALGDDYTDFKDGCLTTNGESDFPLCVEGAAASVSGFGFSMKKEDVGFLTTQEGGRWFVGAPATLGRFLNAYVAALSDIATPDMDDLLLDEDTQF